MTGRGSVLVKGSHAVRSTLPVETEMTFSTADGAQLVFGRGDVAVEVSFAVQRTCASCHLDELDGERPETLQGITDGDNLQLTAAVADGEGRVYSANRQVDAKILLELLSVARYVPHRETWRPLLADFHAWYDHRNLLPAVAVGERGEVFAYWGKNLRLEVALYSWAAKDTDYLIIVGLPQNGVAVSGVDAPESATSSSWAARLAISPGMWWGGISQQAEPLVFALTERTGPRQPRVWAE